jgi:lipopolysaccharide export system permease protein
MSVSSPRSVINRYLGGRFLALFALVLVSLVFLYVVVDFADRLNSLLRFQAGAGAAARYFVFKVPLMVTQVMPPAVMIAVLLVFGTLARRNEIVALRAGGVSLVQSSVAIMVLAGAISVAALIWNETVVPYCSRQFQYVSNVEIRKRAVRSVLNERGIWYHGGGGFYSIEFIDRAREAMYGLTIYRLDDQFQLRRVVTVPIAQWIDGRWLTTGAIEHRLEGGTTGDGAVLSDGLLIPETLDDFLEVQREPEELSFSELHERIDDLARKGIDASHFRVDLYIKLALPFASFALALIAVPIAGRLRRHSSIAAIVGTGAAVGFCYWVVLGLSVSLGQSAAIPPLIAAWAANGIYGLLGILLFLFGE